MKTYWVALIAPVLAMSTGEAPRDEVHFYLPIGIATGANGDVLVSAFFS